ncbi:MAG: type VI secretion system-associated protein TagF [Myxococcales bacterium]|nr:type VI secretion system-associated protein TagF [Myxococcales bacterium]
MNGPSLLGKVPSVRDFARVDLHHEAALELDLWLSRGLEALAERGLEQPPHRTRFVLPFDHGRLVGVLAPSRDQARRRYPVLVFRRVASHGVTHVGLARAAEAFLGAAEALLESSQTLPFAMLEQGVRKLPAVQQQALQPAAELARVSASRLLDQLFGSRKQAVQELSRVLQWLADAGEQGPASPLQCPVASPASIDLWFGLMDMHGPAAPLSAFVCSGVLLVAWGRPNPSLLLQLARLQRSPPGVTAPRASAPLTARVQEVLAGLEQDAVLDQLLSRLPSGRGWAAWADG